MVVSRRGASARAPRTEFESLEDHRIIVGDCVAEMSKLPSGSVDLVFADPPYAKKAGDRDFADELMENESLVDAIEPGGLLILECSPVKEISVFRFWEVTRAKKYGATKLLFCIHKQLPG